jgi:hypothetical protein
MFNRLVNAVKDRLPGVGLSCAPVCTDPSATIVASTQALETEIATAVIKPTVVAALSLRPPPTLAISA